MEKFTRFLEDKLAPFFGKLTENKTLSGLRDGMVTTVPFTIFGSIFIIIQQFPNEKWLEFIKPYQPMLGVPSYFTISIIALYIAFTVGYHLGKSHNQDAISVALISFIAFMMLQINDEYTMITSYFGSRGIFTAILVAIFTVKVVQFFTNKGLIIKFPAGVPQAVSRSFASLIPASVILLVMFILGAVLRINVQEIVIAIFSPLVFALNTLPGILVYMTVSQFLWTAGIHGQSVMNAVGTPIFLQYLTANQEAILTGNPAPYITATGFIPNFISLGGAGATLGLVILMMFSRNKGFKTLGRLSLPAGVFNINEPVIFGFPIVMNPIMMIPFVLVDIILIIGTYLLMAFNIIGRPIAQVPWIMPPILGAYFTTGGNIPAAIWAAVGLVISILVFLPFFKIAEKQREKEALREQDMLIDTQEAL